MSETSVEFRSVGAAGELPDNYVNPYYLEDRRHRVAIARAAGRLYAFDDLCTCAADRCPLSAGQLKGTTLMCQCHGSQFDIATGAVLRGPAARALTTYEVREQDGALQVCI